VVSIDNNAFKFLDFIQFTPEIFRFYTVYPRDFEKSEEHMRCRLDNFSMGFILLDVKLSN